MYINEPIKRLLRQLVLFGMIGNIGQNARPYALEFFQCGRHGERFEAITPGGFGCCYRREGQ